MSPTASAAAGDVVLRPIGRICTPFTEGSGTPVQPTYSPGADGRVLVDEAFGEALDDIEGFEMVWLLYLMDRAIPFEPRVVPFRDTVAHGLFATRSPCRPNPIGISAVELVAREGGTLRVRNVDMLDGSPLLDIKPYVPAFDAYPAVKAGWLDSATGGQRLADNRFLRT